MVLSVYPKSFEIIVGLVMMLLVLSELSSNSV